MNDQLEILWNVTKDIMSRAIYVSLGDMKKVSECIKEQEEEKPWGPPEVFDKRDNKIHFTVQYELLASSINYQYWYGMADLRPNDAGATKMYKLLDESYRAIRRRDCETIANAFIRRLVLNRFPMLEMRIKHIQEVIRGDVSSLITKSIENGASLSQCLESLLINCPGFADDILLKRASLFFMMLYRRLGLFASEINDLPIPADYQVPKMLEGLGCLQYAPELKDKIEKQEIIPSGSRMECEVRAGAIMACKRISELSGKNSSVVDNWLWLKRKEITTPFHLTITTHY